MVDHSLDFQIQIPNVGLVESIRNEVALGYEPVFGPIIQNILTTIPNQFFHGLGVTEIYPDYLLTSLDSLLEILDFQSEGNKDPKIMKVILEGAIKLQQSNCTKFNELWARCTGKELPSVLLERIPVDTNQAANLEKFRQEYKAGIEKVRISFRICEIKTFILTSTIKLLEGGIPVFNFWNFVKNNFLMPPELIVKIEENFQKYQCELLDYSIKQKEWTPGDFIEFNEEKYKILKEFRSNLMRTGDRTHRS